MKDIDYKTKLKYSKRYQRSSMLTSILQTIAIFGFYLAALIIGLLIIFKTSRWGFWWIPILIAYMAIFIYFSGKLIMRKKMLEVRAQIGDELYFEMYPKEYEKEKRRKQRELKAKERREAKRRAKNL